MPIVPRPCLYFRPEWYKRTSLDYSKGEISSLYLGQGESPPRDSVKMRERITSEPASVKALVRWATGKRLTNRLPKLSLITLSPPLNSGILGLRPADALLTSEPGGGQSNMATYSHLSLIHI